MVLVGPNGFFRWSIRGSFKACKALLQERPDGGELILGYGCAGPRTAQRGSWSRRARDFASLSSWRHWGLYPKSAGTELMRCQLEQASHLSCAAPLLLLWLACAAPHVLPREARIGTVR